MTKAIISSPDSSVLRTTGQIKWIESHIGKVVEGNIIVHDDVEVFAPIDGGPYLEEDEVTIVE